MPGSSSVPPRCTCLPLLNVLFFSSFAMYSSHLYRKSCSRGDQPQAGFKLGDAVLDLTRSPILSTKSSSNPAAVTFSPLHLPFGGLAHAGLASLDVAASAVGAEVDMGRFSFPRGKIENWGDSGVVLTSPRTDASTDVDTDDTNQEIVCLDSSPAPKGKAGDQKALHRLSQNREAARKSRLWKKAYIQQLEISRLKLMQLEQGLQRARHQAIFIAGGLFGDCSHSMGGNGAMAFDMEYAWWLDEHQCPINDLRSASNARVSDNELQLRVDAVMTHYDEVLRLKGIGTRSDMFHMLTGMWTTPAEWCFMWLGGFRSSELLKILASHFEPLTDQQLMGICSLQQSSQQAEDALSQGMEASQQSLSDTVASVSLAPSAGSGYAAGFTSRMAIAMGKLGTLESFLRRVMWLRVDKLSK